ncbi:outer membrane protein transport protein [Pseudomonas kuykendallii]|uniref:Long-chain fatty acid transport protein n=1 Tax=Pseudomonas kuykendallii TaxID=1007099 RepID=A0A1H2Z3D5_9PSED|nr:outer membrane protein transport protein [Pseudomonas kuykendallii]MCQ4269414.1 outer membrane protein transport protein [Pseudomonas kuykendallii]SDX11886.1 long-chain fatty acid transport protein [Pseudomonas kuykendallii]
MITKTLKSALAIAIAAASSQVFASGFALNEQSVSGMGTNFAGRSSSAEDSTTVFGNPAGMARLKRQEVSLGAAAIIAKTDIKDTSGLPGNGSNDGDMVPFTAVPAGYYVNPLNDKWAFGFGVYAPFGLITDYEGGFQGRYFGDYSEVKVVTAQPTVSYRFNDQLSVGLGLTVNRISGKLESAVLNAATPGLNDGRARIKGDDTALGYNVGVLYEFSPQTRAGLTYHSMVDYKLEGDTRITGAGFGPFSGSKYDASLKLKTPESADFSITHDLNDQWTVYGGATFTRWSRLESIVVQNDGVPAPLAGNFGTITEEQNWHDTWAYAIGASYKLNKQWVLRAGLGMDQSPANNQDRSPRIPTGDRKTLSLGFGWSPTEDLTIDVAYSYLKEEDVDINQASATKGVYNATYENSAHGIGTQVSYRF